MPLYLISTLVQFRNKYVVEADSLEKAETAVSALDSNPNAEYFGEVTQHYMGETIISTNIIDRSEFDSLIESCVNDPNEQSSYWLGEKLIHVVKD
jgi:hypothetical protein